MKALTRKNPGYSGLDGFEKSARLIAYLCLGLFVAMSALVEAHALLGLDMAVMQAKSQVTSPLLLTWSQAVGVLLSAEFSTIYSAAAVFLLLRMGLGIWSLAPAVWLLGTLVEIVMKIGIDQPVIPPEFRILAGYPLTSVTFPGSFPSGHAMRTGFVCLFVGVLLWSSGGRPSRVSAAALLVLALAGGYARIYMGHHWASDVVAGLLLGISLALLVAPPVAKRILGTATASPSRRAGCRTP